MTALACSAPPGWGQEGDPGGQRGAVADTLAADTNRSAAEPLTRSFSWPKFVAGFVASLAAHESGHLITSVVVGGSPSIGLDKGRPVVHSGIDPVLNPNRQFAFSAAGMAVQLLINEAILDWPRDQPGVAGEFERGVLAGGIGTVLFYFTAGRSSPVSDVQWMADTSGLSKWTLTAIFGGVAALDVARIALKERYAHFFAFPGPSGSLHLGLTVGH